jgi:hypothetical protein
MRGVIVFCIVAILVASLVVSQVEIVETPEKPVMFDDCSEFKIIEKKFVAYNENLELGLFCPRNSRVEVFSCDEFSSCAPLHVVYKNDNKLPKLSGFEIGNIYSYSCFACEGTCAVEYEEEDYVSISNYFRGIDLKLRSSDAPLSDDGAWQTKVGDQGDYNVTINTYDETSVDQVNFCLKINPKPKEIMLNLGKSKFVYSEGDLIDLSLACVYEDGGVAKSSFSGFLEGGVRQLGFDDAGMYDVSVSCISEGVSVISENIEIKVLDVNRAPIIEWILRG